MLFCMLFKIGYSLNDLTRDYRKRIKDLLEGGYKIKFDSKTANQVLRKTVFSYFLQNDNFIFR